MRYRRDRVSRGERDPVARSSHCFEFEPDAFRLDETRYLLQLGGRPEEFFTLRSRQTEVSEIFGTLLRSAEIAARDLLIVQTPKCLRARHSDVLPVERLQQAVCSRS